MNLEELRRYRDRIVALAEANRVSNVRVFGSVARGEATDASDIDFLVTPLPKCGWGLFEFAHGVEDMLGLKVDVVSDRAINRHIKDRVLQEARAL